MATRKEHKEAMKRLVEAVFSAAELAHMTHTEICMAVLSACNPDFNVSVKLTRKRKGKR